jgi:hypothetical protein
VELWGQGFQKSIWSQKSLITGFMKIANIDKTERVFSIKFKKKLNKIEQTKMINRSVFSDLSINFVDLSIGVLTHRSVLSSKTIYRSVFLFIDFQNFHFFKKNDFIC